MPAGFSMSRIRSVHPGLFTDDSFLSLSIEARLFFIGLLVEADDHGIFEWKPNALAARILPGWSGDGMKHLRDEIESAGMVKPFTTAERTLWAVRNFCLWQHPRKPHFRYELPPDVVSYVAPAPTSTAPVRDQFGTSAAPVPDQFPVASHRIGEDRIGKDRKEEYRFAGAIVRLNEQDYNSWRKTYSAIPDLDTELRRIDDRFREDKPAKWFSAASAMLAAKNQRIIAERPPPEKPRTGMFA